MTSLSRFAMPTPDGVVLLTRAPSGQYYVAREGAPTELVDVDELAWLPEVTG